MIRCSIDIGSNSLLLLVADISGNKIKPLAEKQCIPRLGKGVDENNTISHESMRRVIDGLLNYRNYLENNYPSILSSVIITGTSALRDASNRPEVISEIKSETGWHVRLLSGDQEAQTTYFGALSVLSGKDSYYTILDIGGGSTEIASGTATELDQFKSLDLGSVRYTERFLKSNPPNVKEISALRNEVKTMFSGLKKPDDFGTVVGVAGTVTSAAGVIYSLSEDDAELLNGMVLKQDEIQHLIMELSRMTSIEIETRYPKFLDGRGDVILAGLLILDEFLSFANQEQLVVSTGGIRHGVLLNL